MVKLTAAFRSYGTRGGGPTRYSCKTCSERGEPFVAVGREEAEDHLRDVHGDTVDRDTRARHRTRTENAPVAEMPVVNGRLSGPAIEGCPELTPALFDWMAQRIHALQEQVKEEVAKREEIRRERDTYKRIIEAQRKGTMSEEFRRVYEDYQRGH